LTGVNGPAALLHSRAAGISWYTAHMDADPRDASPQASPAEARYSLVMENVPHGVLVVREGRIIFANRALEALSGFTRAELSGKPFTESIHEDDRAMVADRYRRRVRGEAVEATYPFRIRRKDGSAVWVELSAALIEWDGGPATLSFVTDISDRRRLEERLRTGLAEREAILQNTLVGFTHVIDGRHVWVNRRFAEMVGYSQDKLIGMRTAEHFSDEDYWWSLWESARTDLEQGGRFSGECQMRRRDGTAFWANISGSLVDASDMSRGRLWTILDISRRKQAEEDIRAALAREKELSELKSRFVSMTSHEFRTPLATILSSVELLRDYGDKLPREERAELVGLIEAAVQHMARMLDDVLAIGRAESGKLAFRPEPIALRALCERLPEDAMGAVPGAARRREDLVVDLEAVPERARADEKLLRQILGNLLSNAFKYSPQGGRVSFEVRGRDGGLEFSVADEGIGLPPEDLPRLFSTFFRASNVGHIAGTGLGLAIVKHCVELHGGRIEVAPGGRGGTRFTVWLPISGES
jgi:PAS domain S-box-containing protein